MPASEPDPEGAPPIAAAARAAPGLRARDALLALFVYLAAQIGTGFLVGVWVGVGYALRGGDPNDAEALEALTTQIEGAGGVLGAALGGLAVGLLVLRRIRIQPEIRGQVGLSPGTPSAAAAGLAAGAAIAAVYLLTAIHIAAPELDAAPGPITRMGLAPGWQRELWTVSALLLFPAVEELVFRGAIHAGLRRSFGLGPAALVTTVLFVGLHAAEFQTYLPAAAALTALAVAALFARERSGALGPAVAVHLGYNAVIVAATRLLETG